MLKNFLSIKLIIFIGLSLLCIFFGLLTRYSLMKETYYKERLIDYYDLIDPLSSQVSFLKMKIDSLPYFLRLGENVSLDQIDLEDLRLEISHLKDFIYLHLTSNIAGLVNSLSELDEGSLKISREFRGAILGSIFERPDDITFFQNNAESLYSDFDDKFNSFKSTLEPVLNRYNENSSQETFFYSKIYRISSFLTLLSFFIFVGYSFRQIFSLQRRTDVLGDSNEAMIRKLHFWDKLSNESSLNLLVSFEGDILSASKQFMLLVGGDVFDVYGRNIKDFFPGIYLNEIIRKKELNLHKIALKTFDEGREYFFDAHLVHFRSENVIYFSLLDMTKYFLLEDELSFLTNRYHAIVDDLPDMICRFDTDFSIGFMNQTFCDFFDISSESLDSVYLSSLLNLSDFYTLKKILLSLNEQKKLETLELLIDDCHGERRKTLWRVRALFTPSLGVYEYHVVISDMTSHFQTIEDLSVQKKLLQRSEEVSLTGHITYELHSKKLYCSDQVYQILGVARDDLELDIEQFFDFFDKSEIDFPSIFIPSLEAGESFQVKSKVRRASGESSWVLVKGYPQALAENKANTSCFAIVKDISAEVFQEEEMRKSNLILSNLLNIQDLFLTGSDCYQTWSIVVQKLIGVVRCEGGFMLSADLGLGDEPHLSLLGGVGYSFKLNVGDNFQLSEFSSHIKHAFFNGSFQQLEGLKSHALGFAHPYLKELVLIPITYGSGTIGILGFFNTHRLGLISSADEWSYFEPILGAVGNLLHAYLENIDKKRVEKILEEKSALFELAVRGTNDAIWEWNFETQTVWCSNRWKEMLGYEPDELETNLESWNSLIFDGDREDTLSLVDSCRSGELSELNITQRYHHKNGSTVYILSRATVQKGDDGKALRLVGAYTDITDFLRVQKEAEASSAAKGAFLANMSHEIRTPMNGVIGMLSLLERTSLNKAQSEYVNAIRSSSESLLGLINDILDFSKLEENKLSLDIYDFSLTEVLEGTLNSVSPMCFEKGLDLGIVWGKHVPQMLKGDSLRLRQIVINLLSNAIKVTDSGRIEVHVDAKKERGKWRVYCSVLDTGPGIPKDLLVNIFDRFTQVDQSLTRKIAGTGLGLSICQKLVGLMGGSIDVETDENVGSRFFFDILLDVSEQDEVVDTSSIPAISILEMDEFKQRCVTSALERLGIKFNIYPLQGLLDLHQDDLLLAELDSLQDEAVRSSIEQTEIILFLTPYQLEMLDPSIESFHVRELMFLPLRQMDLLKSMRKDHSSLSISEILQEKKSGVELSSDLGDVRILVAEDAPVNQKYCKTLLEHMGATVVIVPDGSLAVQAFERESFDIILMDMQMPVMDGLEATRQIRMLEKGKARIPIIALTANVLQKDHDMCIDAGMDDFLAKPIRAETLLSAVLNYISHQTDAEEVASVEQVDLSSAEKVIDVDELSVLRQTLGEDDLKRLFGAFVQSSQELIDVIGGNDILGDGREAVHKLKGESGTLGLKSLQEICYKMQGFADSSNVVAWKEILPELERRYQQVLSWIESYTS